MSNILEKLQLIGFAFVLLLLVWSFMSVASAETTILEGEMTAVNAHAEIVYYPQFEAYGVPAPTSYGFNHICFKDIEKFRDVSDITFTWKGEYMTFCGVTDCDSTDCIEDCADAAFWNVYYTMDPLVPIKLKAGTIHAANVTFGYNRGLGDVYHINLHFLDKTDWWDTASGNVALTFTYGGDICRQHCYDWLTMVWTSSSCGNLEFYSAKNLGSVYDFLESGECVVSVSSGGANHYMLAKIGDDYGYDTRYNILTLINYYQPYRVIEGSPGAVYTIEYDRITTSMWSTKVKIWNDDYTFYEDQTYSLQNISVPIYGVMATSLCANGFHISCQYSTTGYSNNSYSGFCTDVEPGIFDMQGYTRSIYGNLIDGVLLDCQGENTNSSDIGFYKFENLETGYFWLNASKTGFYDDNSSMLIGKGDLIYQHDVYMIPEDALESGEFGGIVYDYCSLEVVENARVYLYNVTSGDESYVYSNEYGFFKFPDLDESMTYKLRSSAVGYEESAVYSFQFNETDNKTYNLWLLPEGGCDEETGGVPTPSPTPSPTPTPETPINDLFDMLGLGEYMNFILALLVILFCGGSFGRIGKGNEMAIVVGAFFGFIVDVALGWLPRWLLALVIIVTVAFLAFQLKK